MPALSLRVYSALFKALLRYRFNRNNSPLRSEVKSVPPNAAFVDGVATKDVVLNEYTGLSVRIFLPDSAIQEGRINGYSWVVRHMASKVNVDSEKRGVPKDCAKVSPYGGYMPQEGSNHHKLPVIVQFHAGGFVVGSKDSASNDTFCRRIAKMCNSIVVAVSYRLAPEHKCPAAYDDGYEVLRWLARQAALDTNETAPERVCTKEGTARPNAAELRETARSLVHDEVPDPWLTAHGDVSRVVLLGASSGGNVADHVARRASTPQATMELGYLSVAGQVLLYPLFSGKVPTPSEVKLASTSYFFDKPTLDLVWRLFLPDGDFSLDHPAVNPLIKGECPPGMPPTLIVTAEHDMLRDRAVAYAAFLQRLGVAAQINDYKDCVHGFATAEPLINSPQAQGCAEDISVWLHRHLALRGELSY